MMVLFLVLPPVCAPRKYHTRSVTIEPPSVAERSYTFAYGAAGRTPRPIKSGVRLSDCNRAPVPLANIDPCIALPPDFGTMFITSPEVSHSPSPPDVENVTSWACPTSKSYIVAELPVGGLPTV